MLDYYYAINIPSFYFILLFIIIIIEINTFIQNFRIYNFLQQKKTQQKVFGFLFLLSRIFFYLIASRANN